MPQYMTPGLYFEIVDTAQKDIDPTRVDIPAFLGYATQGPVHQPTQINSQAQFQAIFGGFTSNSYLAYTVRAFFENGGTRCYAVRIASKSAKAAHIVFLDEAAKPTLCVSASSPGSWGNDLMVSLTRTSMFATQMIPKVERPAGKKILFVESVVGFSPGTLVKLFQQKTPNPLTGYIVVTESTPGSQILTWNDEYTDDKQTPLDKYFDLSQALSLETVEFALTVYLAGQLRETFPLLSLVPASDRYVTNVISEKTSQLIRVKDLQSPTPLPQRFPDPAKIPGPIKSVKARYGPDNQKGSDGFADVQLEDFTGDPASEEKRGMRKLEDVPDVTTIAMPDLTLQPMLVPTTASPVPPSCPCPPYASARDAGPSSSTGQPTAQAVEQPPAFSLDQVFHVQQAMIDFCDSQKRFFALLDPPMQSPGKILSIADIQSWRRRFDSRYAALYYPLLLVYDPLRLNGQIVRAIPPCGHVAGMFARVDHDTGPHRAPANEELNWVQGVNIDITSSIQGLLNPQGINCIRTFPGRGIRIFGARTVSNELLWRYVNVRRLFTMIERSLEAGMQWAVFEPNDFALRQTLVANINVFLETLWLQGAFAGASPSEAFFVKIDDQNNPPELADQGQLLVEIGVAPALPAEFVIFRIGLTLDKLEITEQSSS